MTTAKIDVNGCRCVRCGSSDLNIKAADVPIDEIVPGAVFCASCDEPYDAVWGVLFLGSYEPEDYIGLIEIAYNADHYDVLSDINQGGGTFSKNAKNCSTITTSHQTTRP